MSDIRMIDTLESPYIHAATYENFKALVLDNSNQGPVLVNFWSARAGPCLRLYPLLDTLIHHYKGRMLLVNIDTQTEFKVTREYGITSVPTLKLFRNGEVMETVYGYQSEAGLKKTFDGYVARDSDQSLTGIIELYSKGETVQAYEKLAGAIMEDPVNPRLPLAMCKLLNYEQRYAEAIKLVKSLPEDIRRNYEITKLYRLLLKSEQSKESTGE